MRGGRKNRAAEGLERAYKGRMQSASTSPETPDQRLERQASDYQRMASALGWLAERWRDRPSLDAAAAAAGLSPFHFQRLFTRWAGVSPRTFVAAIAHAQARSALEEGESVLGAALEAGLSGPSRLHDLFIAHETATPGVVRRRGQGLAISWGFAPTPFGMSVFAETDLGLCGLGFFDPGEEAHAFEDMRRRWPAAQWVRRDDRARAASAKVFGGGGEPFPLVLMGPPFHVQVWKALLRIPAGRTATYADVAAWSGRPGAFRAAGAAVGANPISLLIPCHRAIAADGRLTGYHWGLARKAAMLGVEALETAPPELLGSA